MMILVTLKQNKGKFMVGKVRDFAKRKGWFFGHFADHALLKSNLVEVGWQDISNHHMQPAERHLHQRSVEINLVISGLLKITINGETFAIAEGDFYIIWPGAVIENGVAGPRTQVIVVRAPSILNDKLTIG